MFALAPYFQCKLGSQVSYIASKKFMPSATIFREKSALRGVRSDKGIRRGASPSADSGIDLQPGELPVSPLRGNQPDLAYRQRGDHLRVVRKPAFDGADRIN